MPTRKSSLGDNGASIGQDNEQELSLAEELGVEDLSEVIFGARGRLFSACGTGSPIAEVKEECLVLHPPQKPFTEEGLVEDVTVQVNENGILLDAIGRCCYIAGAKFHNRPVYVLGQTAPDSSKHCACWLDEQGKAHQLVSGNVGITADDVVHMRNCTPEGEISVFEEITSL